MIGQPLLWERVIIHDQQLGWGRDNVIYGIAHVLTQMNLTARNPIPVSNRSERGYVSLMTTLPVMSGLQMNLRDVTGPRQGNRIAVYARIAFLLSA